MRLKKFLKHNWKKILVILIIFAIWYFVGGTGHLHIPGIGFNSGGAILSAYKSCDCVGIPNNDNRMGGSHSYCIGLVTNCHCYLIDYPTGKDYSHGTKQEVDCKCPEGKYVFSFGTDACNLFKNW